MLLIGHVYMYSSMIVVVLEYMAKVCQVCEHPQVKEINLRLLEGMAAMQIAQQYGGGHLSRVQIERHRSKGHAARSINEAIITAGSGPIAVLGQVAISKKLERLNYLQELVDKCMFHIRADHAKDLINHKLVQVAANLIKQGAEEMGEWRPDGGKAAEATAKLAQSIVIYAASNAGIDPTRIKSAEIVGPAPAESAE